MRTAGAGSGERTRTARTELCRLQKCSNACTPTHSEPDQQGQLRSAAAHALPARCRPPRLCARVEARACPAPGLPGTARRPVEPAGQHRACAPLPALRPASAGVERRHRARPATYTAQPATGAEATLLHCKAAGDSQHLSGKHLMGNMRVPPGTAHRKALIRGQEEAMPVCCTVRFLLQAL